MIYYLIYQNEELGKAWRREFSDAQNIKIINGDITEQNCDAIVSPANSFGFMDGGLDLYLSEKLGWDLQKKLQEKIKQLTEGELLIGKALILETGNERIPFLISAPTMRVPMNFNIATSINAYLAMKAILISSRSHSEINSVAIPGLCTGVGRMPVEIAAHQMFMAYSEIELDNRLDFNYFGEAQKHFCDLNKNGLIYE